MKLSLLTLAFALLIGIPTIAKAMEGHKDKAMMSKPVVKAVAFHSDNCGSCQILSPKMKKAMNAINQDKVDVVKLDFTTAATKDASMKLAAQKGISNLFNEYGPKTGFVVIINNQGKVLDMLKVDHDTPEIAAKLANAVATAS